jgi:hypothetical protein
MFVLKSTHEALIAAKDAQIAALQDEVRFLRHMVQPKFADGFKINTEANALLDSRQDQIDLSDHVAPLHNDEISQEADRILNGTY